MTPLVHLRAVGTRHVWGRTQWAKPAPLSRSRSVSGRCWWLAPSQADSPGCTTSLRRHRTASGRCAAAVHWGRGSCPGRRNISSTRRISKITSPGSDITRTTTGRKGFLQEMTGGFIIITKWSWPAATDSTRPTSTDCLEDTARMDLWVLSI